jgi:tryptophan synthase beta chain
MAASDVPTKLVLDERDIPTHWYNIISDLPRPPAAVLHPGTGQPVGPADLAPLFPMALIAQEVSQEPRIEIPEQVREVYRLWRPTPLYRAHRLERALDTPAHIYYKLLRPRKAPAKLGNGPIPLQNPFSAQEPVSL